MSDYRMNAHEEHDDGRVHAHISSIKFYITIFTALIILTVTTVGVSYIHLGPANLAVAIIIASIKAALVCLFFMHLRHDNKFHALIFVSSLLFIGVFFAYTVNDTGRRGEVDDSQGTQSISPSGSASAAAPGGDTRPEPKGEPEELRHEGHAPDEADRPAEGHGH
jgi:cytochrome c oxidase subunit 4